MKLLVAILAALTLAATATAENLPNPLFDTVASEVAGKPVAVWCESSWDDWVAIGAGAANGFTYPDTATVFLSPRQCETLWALSMKDDVGSFYAASALLTLAHEAIHQRGVTDEGEADCLALPLLQAIAITHFGASLTVAQSYTYTTSRLVSVSKKKRVRVSSTKVGSRQVPNPWLARIETDALRWHQSKPAEYQGTC